MPIPTSFPATPPSTAWPLATRPSPGPPSCASIPMATRSTRRAASPAAAGRSALVLLPGVGGAAGFWGLQVPAFVGDFPVIGQAHRGCGRSSRSRIAYSVEQMADDVLQLMDALGIEPAHFVGHSTGGAIGQV